MTDDERRDIERERAAIADRLTAIAEELTALGPALAGDDEYDALVRQVHGLQACAAFTARVADLDAAIERQAQYREQQALVAWYTGVATRAALAQQLEDAAVADAAWRDQIVHALTAPLLDRWVPADPTVVH